MPPSEVAVLSYHGWEIDPELLAGDVRALRAQGWTAVSLDDLKGVVTGNRRTGRHFHMTIDDGAERDRDCVNALRALSCPVTLFVSLDIMSPAARIVYSDLMSQAGVAVEDHSLRHERAFHYRHVIGFHSDERPLMTSPERMGLVAGDPVCAYGGELARRRFLPDPRALESCRSAAADVGGQPGTAQWTKALTDRLVESGFGYRRLGRLCIAGVYETHQAFSGRISTYLSEGRRRLTSFTGRAPTAFAHPWWEPSPPADARLTDLGYELTFAGRGLCRRRGALGIPRLFVSNATVRPIDPVALAADAPASATGRWLRDVGRRAVYA
jgi:peptidoglycan/xylan/chitin deacetylase (PgdA/CDA1 family)